MPAVVVATVWVYWLRRLRPGVSGGIRTVATTVSRCTSSPAQRSTNTSITTPPSLIPVGRRPGEACRVKSLRFALAAAGQGASGLRAILLCELVAPSVIGVGPEATV